MGGTAVNAEWYRGEYINIFVSFMQKFMAVCVKELFVFLSPHAAERLKGVLPHDNEKCKQVCPPVLRPRGREYGLDEENTDRKAAIVVQC